MDITHGVGSGSFWRNQLDQSTPCVSTELNKKGIIWGFPRCKRYAAKSKNQGVQK